MAGIPIGKPKLLVVEGKDEVFFFGALLSYLVLQDIQAVDMEGKTNLRSRLDAIVKSPGFPNVSCLGVVRDADSDPIAAFQSVRDALDAVGLPVPNEPLTFIGQNPQVAVVILPEKDKTGMLEDLCLKSVEQDPAIPCVEQYFQCRPQQGVSLPHHMAKARVRVFLASRPEPDKRLGEAAQAGYWPLDSEAFTQLKRFLQQIRS